MKDTVYAIVDASGDGTPLLNIPTVDEKGVSQYPNVYTTELPGYYRPSEPGGKLIFTVDKDKEYVIYAKKDTKTDVVIVGPEIEGVTIVDYDDKGTLERNDDDTISIEVNPADPGYQYAILNKVDGKYYDMPVEYDPVKKEYVYDKDKNDGFLTTGGEGKVIFSNLPADGTYKVVAIPVGKTIDDEIYQGLKPSQIQGGSPDIISVPKPIQSPKPSESPDPGSSSDPSASATPDPNASATPDPNASTKPDPNASATPDPNASGKPSASPSASASATPSSTPGAGNATAAPLDPDQQSRVDKFVEEHGKNPSTGEIIKKVDDLTKDVVSSGEKEWNQLSSAEQDAVNQRLKDGGCPYTYQELLQMANTYKIPGFKLHKVMKKNSKAKLKLMKCKGATIIVTSTNKKVATVNKKGVIKAKKKGKATLTVTAVKGKYSNRLVINIEVRKKFKNATELKKFKSNRIKTPTILIAKKRKLKKSTKIKIYGLEKNAKVKYISYNKKALPINKKGRYTAKKKGRSLMRVTVKQNDKTYFLYLYVTAFK
ncbi:MAG: Ig-like domain-containing protein [Roseburia sp.]|nr:Ig-like domain-containing protein [Roseburia sp.]